MPIPLTSTFGLLAPPAPALADRYSRCLFGFEAGGGELVSAGGDAGTFARTTDGTTVDHNGHLVNVSPKLPRWYALDLDGDGVRESLGLLLERAGSNLAIRSDSSWTLTGVTVTAAWQDVGDYSLSRVVGTADAGRIDVTVSTTGITTGLKGVSLVAAPSPNPRPGGVQWQVFDTTSAASIFTASIKWNADGTPNVTTTLGTFLGYEALAGGAYRLYGVTGVALTVAHTVTVQVYVSLGAGERFDGVFGCIQVDNGPYPTSFIPTTGAVGTRALETLTFPLAWLPQDHTLFAELARPVWAAAPGGLSHYPLALGVAGTSFSGLHDSASALPSALRQENTVSTNAATATVLPAARGILRERYAWAAQAAGWTSRRTPPTMRTLSDVATALGTAAAGTAPASSWGGGPVRLHGSTDDGANAPDAVLLAARVAPGLRTLDEMRGVR